MLVIKSEKIDIVLNLKDMPVELLQAGGALHVGQQGRSDVTKARVERPLAITSCVPRYDRNLWPYLNP